MLLNCDGECRAGWAVAAPPRHLRPRGRGWAGLIRVPGCHFSAGEQQRLQSVQWFGRGARGGGAHGGARGAVCGRQRRNAEDVPSRGRWPGFPGIGRMRRSNPRPDRRPTVVVAAVQPGRADQRLAADKRARRRRPKHATPPRATHRHGTVTNLGGTATRRRPRRTPAAAQPPPPTPPRGRLEGFALPWRIGWF
jgi:hypothetical protein